MAQRAKPRTNASGDTLLSSNSGGFCDPAAGASRISS